MKMMFHRMLLLALCAVSTYGAEVRPSHQAGATPMAMEVDAEGESTRLTRRDHLHRREQAGSGV